MIYSSCQCTQQVLVCTAFYLHWMQHILDIKVSINWSSYQTAVIQARPTVTMSMT